MFKHFRIILAALVVMSVGMVSAQGGLIGALRDKVTGGGQDPQQAAPQPPPSPEQVEQERGKARSTARNVASKMTWDGIPRNLFKQYAGKWEGNFWVYGNDGRKKQVQKVSVTYTPQQDGTMQMESFYFDMVSKQWVTSEKAVYAINGDSVTVTVNSALGAKSHTQSGHYSDGQLFLRSNIKDGVEHYRERVRGDEILIDGYGVYESIKGDDHNVFIGRMKRTG